MTSHVLPSSPSRSNLLDVHRSQVVGVQALQTTDRVPISLIGQRSESCSRDDWAFATRCGWRRHSSTVESGSACPLEGLATRWSSGSLPVVVYCELVPLLVPTSRGSNGSQVN